MDVEGAVRRVFLERKWEFCPLVRFVVDVAVGIMMVRVDRKEWDVKMNQDCREISRLALLSAVRSEVSVHTLQRG